MALSVAHLEELTTILLLVGVCALFLRLGFLALAILRLKSRHRAKWQELECPTPRNWAKFRRYFSRGGEYKELTDQTLDSCVTFSRVAGYASLVALLGLLVLFFATFIVTQTAPHLSTADFRVTDPINAVGIALLVCVAGYVAAVSFAIARLRKLHHATWQALECPAFLGGHSRFLEYVWARRDRELNDPRLSNIVTAMKIFALGFFTLFVLAVLKILPR